MPERPTAPWYLEDPVWKPATRTRPRVHGRACAGHEHAECCPPIQRLVGGARGVGQFFAHARWRAPRKQIAAAQFTRQVLLVAVRSLTIDVRSLRWLVERARDQHRCLGNATRRRLTAVQKTMVVHRARALLALGWSRQFTGT